MLTLTLTFEEAQTLAKIIDAAVRVHGLELARAALPLFDKIEQAAKSAVEPAPTQEETA